MVFVVSYLILFIFLSQAERRLFLKSRYTDRCTSIRDRGALATFVVFSIVIPRWLRIMARHSTGAHIVKQPAFFLNKTRLLLYGSASLALFIIHLWTHTGFLARSIILSAPDALRGRSPRRARSFLDVHHAASSEVILDTLASAGAPTECCGEVSASFGPIPASNHLLVFVSVLNVASGTARPLIITSSKSKNLPE